MKSSDTLAKALPDAGDDLFEMANLYPRTTGLPMTIWVSPRGNPRHDARIKVHLSHGDSMVPDHTAVVAIRPAPHLIAGKLRPADQGAVCHWVAKNQEALMAYWDGAIDTVELVERLQRV